MNKWLTQHIEKELNPKPKLEKIISKGWKLMTSGNDNYDVFGKSSKRIIYMFSNDKIIRIYTDKGIGGYFHNIN